MFGSRATQAAANPNLKQKASRFSLPDAVRIDRRGNAIADTVPMLVHKLPSADEARDSIVGTAQRALGKARGGIGSALDQLPDSFTDMQIPGRKQKRRKRKWILRLAVLGGLAAVGYFAYRRLFGDSFDESDEYGIDRSWPAEPNPGTVHEAPESDQEASVDAEQSAAVLDQTAPPPVNTATGTSSPAGGSS